jgi:penicillin amidase
MQSEKIHIPGLNQSADIYFDQWGIPHIYAQGDADLYFCQGYVAAQMRLWQMDMWRKRGLGQLAADFGPAFVEQDAARRLLLYRGDMQAEWNAYGDGVRETTEAFVRGINAWVTHVRAHPELLPPEFRAGGHSPALWQAQDIVRIRSVGLRMNIGDELARCRMAAAGGLDRDGLRRHRDPAQPLVMPLGLDPALLPANTLRLYQLALAELNLAALPAQTDPEPAAPPGATASNVWALGPQLTQTGRPIFANDPHRTHITPSVRWLVHLNAPGIQAAGATEPTHPGVSNGHNGHLAFGFTYSPSDQEDLYVYTLHPTDASLYRYGDGWERFTFVDETIDVAGAAPHSVQLAYTRHGPVLHMDRERGACVAVRSAFLMPGGAPYYAGVAYHRARDVNHFRQLLDNAVAPTMNYCATDTAGNVGLFVRGRVPVRDGWDGLMPVPGDGRFEWNGFVAPDDLPTEVNPAQGWVASCNHTLLKDSYPYSERRIGFEYSDPARFERLQQLVQSQAQHSLADNARYQNDQTFLGAVPLVAQLLHTAPALPADLTQVLAAWRGDFGVDSVAAGFFALWSEAHLRPALVRLHAGDGAQRAIIGVGDWRGLLAAPIPDEVLRNTAAEAAQVLAERIGPDTARWTLGAVQTVRIAHPLAQRMDATASLGPQPLGGHANALNKAESFLPDLQVRHGPSFRIVLDVGAWDNCLAVNMPGQSGDPRSPHYRDMVAPWQSGEYVPLLWSRDRVQQSAVRHLQLQPAG